jgi:hypothetical protein
MSPILLPREQKLSAIVEAIRKVRRRWWMNGCAKRLEREELALILDRKALR